MKKHIANIITGFRIFCSMVMLFLPVFSPAFFTAYLLCGFTDMIDGSVARWTNSVSEAGSRLDTAADFVFLTVAFIKFLSAMQIPGWLWIWAGVIAVIKLSNIIAGLIRGNGFVALHSVMNKITGLVLFLFPLTLSYIEVQYSAAVVCLIATCAAIWECPIFNLAIVLQKRYNELL
ncbi:MAG: CDP-alcohol phosphatidyltransferase family protein [Peptococcaceae bacterium]|nr:CDP-alcohol phosphatidyltransferase family protein [Peptococcaceae bacterium]